MDIFTVLCEEFKNGFDYSQHIKDTGKNTAIFRFVNKKMDKVLMIQSNTKTGDVLHSMEIPYQWKTEVRSVITGEIISN